MAKAEKCPICGVSVQPQNLVRHLDSIHPRDPATPALREKLRREPGRAPHRTRGPVRVPKAYVIAAVVVALAVAAAFYVAPILNRPAEPFPCVTGTLVYHWHTQLYLNVGGIPYAIPADIGLTASCSEPLHTHDTSGLIHIETDVPRLYRIGDFFTVWGKPFGSPTSMLVNGTALPSPSSGQILWDQENITLNYASFS